MHQVGSTDLYNVDSAQPHQTDHTQKVRRPHCQPRAPVPHHSALHIHQRTHPPSPPCAGQPQWTTRGLLDFNLLFPLWPDAFPKGPGAYATDPPRAAFANLKEGFAWSDASRGFVITVRKVAECDSQVWKCGVIPAIKMYFLFLCPDLVSAWPS